METKKGLRKRQIGLSWGKSEECKQRKKEKEERKRQLVKMDKTIKEWSEEKKNGKKRNKKV